jgi:hypothetical protein
MRKSPRDARPGRIQTAAQKENGGHALAPRARTTGREKLKAEISNLPSVIVDGRHHFAEK